MELLRNSLVGYVLIATKRTFEFCANGNWEIDRKYLAFTQWVQMYVTDTCISIIFTWKTAIKFKLCGFKETKY